MALIPAEHMQPFDEASLLSRLSELRPNQRLTFAATCAQRLLPYYLRYCEMFRRGDPVSVRKALTLAWQHAADPKSGLNEMKSLAPIVMDLAPGDEAEWTPLNPLAENAAAAAYYCLDCAIDGKPKSAALAARQEYEAVDYLAHNIKKIKFGSVQAEKEILSTEIVQEELSKQERDLDLLTSHPLTSELLNQLRETAENEGVVVLNQTIQPYLDSLPPK